MRHLSEPVRGVSETVALAAIARAIQDEDYAKAEKFRRMWEDFVSDGIGQGQSLSRD